LKCAPPANGAARPYPWTDALHRERPRWTAAGARSYRDRLVSFKRSPTSHSYFSKRLRLHYLDWGNENAPPLLMIHGNRDHAHNWDWMADRLADQYHILAPDLRGHGDSQWGEGSAYAISEFVYDIAQLVRQTRSAPVRIVAHSLGGNVALRYAGVFPTEVLRLVSIEGYGRPANVEPESPVEQLRTWIELGRAMSMRSPRRYASLDDAFERMQDANPHLSPEQARHLTVHGSNQNEDGSYSWKFDNFLHLDNPWDFGGGHVRTFSSEITCPVLLISGAESWAARAGNDLLPDFRDARHEIVAHAGHWVHHDQLDGVTDLVREFLR
jgi:pimeloyl-ACP methyl ester carboxylesterase